MSKTVGDIRALDCTECVGLTTHYLYHNGGWICEECGAKYE